MKIKYLTMGLCVVISLSMAACSGTDNKPKPPAGSGPTQTPKMPANAVQLTTNNGPPIVALMAPIQEYLSLAADGYPEDIAASSCVKITGDDHMIIDAGKAVYTFTNCNMLNYTLNGNLNFSFTINNTLESTSEHYVLSGNITLTNSSDTVEMTDINIVVKNQVSTSNIVESLNIEFALSSKQLGGFIVTTSKPDELLIQGAGPSKITYNDADTVTMIDVSGKGVFVPLP